MPQLYHFIADQFKENLMLGCQPHQQHMVAGRLCQYLKSWQLDGLRFLYKNYEKGEACILNDESGLGKVVTVSTFLGSILTNDTTKKCLIIVRDDEAIEGWRFHLSVLTHLTVKVIERTSDINYETVYLIKWSTLKNISEIDKVNFDHIIIDNRGEMMNNKFCTGILLRYFENKTTIIISSVDVTSDIKLLHILLRLCGRLDKQYTDVKAFEDKFQLPQLREGVSNKVDLEDYFLKRERVINFCREFRLRRYCHQFDDEFPIVSRSQFQRHLEQWKNQNKNSLSSGSIKKERGTHRLDNEVQQFNESLTAIDDDYENDADASDDVVVMSPLVLVSESESDDDDHIQIQFERNSQYIEEFKDEDDKKKKEDNVKNRSKDSGKISTVNRRKSKKPVKTLEKTHLDDSKTLRSRALSSPKRPLPIHTKSRKSAETDKAHVESVSAKRKRSDVHEDKETGKRHKNEETIKKISQKEKTKVNKEIESKKEKGNREEKKGSFMEVGQKRSKESREEKKSSSSEAEQNKSKENREEKTGSFSGVGQKKSKGSREEKKSSSSEVEKKNQEDKKGSSSKREDDRQNNINKDKKKVIEDDKLSKIKKHKSDKSEDKKPEESSKYKDSREADDKKSTSSKPKESPKTAQKDTTLHQTTKSEKTNKTQEKHIRKDESEKTRGDHKKQEKNPSKQLEKDSNTKHDRHQSKDKSKKKEEDSNKKHTKDNKKDDVSSPQRNRYEVVYKSPKPTLSLMFEEAQKFVTNENIGRLAKKSKDKDRRRSKNFEIPKVVIVNTPKSKPRPSNESISSSKISKTPKESKQTESDYKDKSETPKRTVHAKNLTELAPLGVHSRSTRGMSRQTRSAVPTSKYMKVAIAQVDITKKSPKTPKRLVRDQRKSIVLVKKMSPTVKISKQQPPPPRSPTPPVISESPVESMQLGQVLTPTNGLIVSDFVAPAPKNNDYHFPLMLDKETSDSECQITSQASNNQEVIVLTGSSSNDCEMEPPKSTVSRRKAFSKMPMVTIHRPMFNKAKSPDLFSTCSDISLPCSQQQTSKSHFEGFKIFGSELRQPAAQPRSCLDILERMLEPRSGIQAGKKNTPTQEKPRSSPHHHCIEDEDAMFEITSNGTFGNTLRVNSNGEMSPIRNKNQSTPPPSGHPKNRITNYLISNSQHTSLIATNPQTPSLEDPTDLLPKTPKRRKSLCVNVKRSPRSSNSGITGGKSQSTKLTQWLVKNSNAQKSDSPGKSLTTKRRRLDLSFPDK